jgi:nitroreductase
MTQRLTPNPVQALRRAAVRATLAPSVDNTQPWRFVLRPDALEVHADPTRWSQVLDPAGRQMLISCGCALFNARVSLAAAGFLTHVQRFPDPSRPAILACVTSDPELQALGAESDGLAIGVLDPLIDQRRSDKRGFVAEAVPDAVIAELVHAAAGEGAQLRQVTSPHDRRCLVSLSREADEWEAADGSSGELPAVLDGLSDGLDGCLLVLGTAEDSLVEWLRAGEALERVLLEVARRGLAVLPLTRVIEVAHLRSRLRSQLRLSMQPHVLLRIGRAPPMPPPRRRRLVEMLAETA